MTVQQVTLDEAKAQLVDLIDAAIGGETVLMTKDDRQVVRLVPVAPSKQRPQFGSARGLIIMSDDFDEPLEDFKDYME